MKSFLLLIAFLFTFQGMAQTLLQGQSSGSAKNQAQTLQVPFSQSTKVSSTTSMIETGNFNQLKNPGGESLTDTSWVGTPTGTAICNISGSATNPLFGKNSVYARTRGGASGGTCTLTQDVPVPTGLDTEVSVWLSSSSATQYTLYMRKDGVNVAETATAVTQDGKYRLYKFQSVAGATSMGIGITITLTAVADRNIQLDEAYVGYKYPSADVPGARLIGGVTIAGCNWQTSSTTLADYGATTGCTYTTFGEALAPSTMIPGIRFSSLPAGEYMVVYSGGLTSIRAGGSAGASTFRISDGTNVSRELVGISAYTGGDNANNTNTSATWSINYSSDQANPVLRIQGAASNANAIAAVNFVAGIGVIPNPGGTIKVYYFPSRSSIISWKNKDFAQRPATCSGSWTTNSTYTCLISRKGNMAYIDYRIDLAGAPNAAILNLNAPILDGVQLNIDSAKIINTTNNRTDLGRGTISDVGVSAYPITAFYTSPTSVVLFREFISGSNTTYADQITNTVPFTSGSGDTLNIKVSIPILGWDTSDLAVIDIKDMVRVVGSNSGASLFYATANVGCSSSPCTLSNNKGGTISQIVRTAAGTFQAQFTGLSSVPTCNVNIRPVISGGNKCQPSGTATATTFNFECTNSGGTGQDEGFYIMCMGERL